MIPSSADAGLTGRLGTVFNLHPAERLPVALLLAHSFFKGISFIFIETPASTLFLSTLSAHAMPYVYLATSIVGTLLGLGYARLETGLSPARLLAGTLIFLTFGTAAVGATLAIDRSPATIMAAMIWKDIVWILGGLEFWALAGLLLDLRQSKRLFPLIGSGEVCAMVAGGLAVPFFIDVLGTIGLFAVACIGFLASLALFLRAIKLIPQAQQHMSDADTAHRDARPLSIRATLRNRYLALFFALTALSYLAYYLIDYLFYETVEKAFQDEAQLARFFGLFYAIMGAAQFVVGAFMAAPLIRRFGIGFGLCALPLACLLTAFSILGFAVWAGLVTAMFWTVAATKMLDEVLRVGIEVPAFRILYQPLPAHQKLRVQALRETILEPLAIGVSGALLLLLTNFYPVSTSTLVGFLIAVLAAAIFLASRITREYMQILLRSLARRELPDSESALQDAKTQALLLAKLKTAKAADAIFCSISLEKSGYAGIDDVFRRLLHHPEATARAHALARLEQRAGARVGEHDALTPTLLRMVEVEATPALQAAALHAFMASAGPSSIETALTLLLSPDPVLRKAALIGLLRHGGIDGVLEAGQAFKNLLASPIAEDRIMAAAILGEARAPGFYRPLIDLMADRELHVRRAALQAAGSIAHPRLAPQIVQLLGEAPTRAAAMSALRCFGAEAVPVLEGALAQKPLHHPLRRLLTTAIGAIRAPVAARALIRLLAAPDAIVRQAALEALVDRRHEATAEEALAITAHLTAEIEDAGFLCRLKQVVEAKSPLDRALADEIIATRRRALLWLTLIVPGRPMRDACRAILAKPGQRANAVEALEGMLPMPNKADVMQLIEAADLGSHGAPSANGEQNFSALLTHRCATPWLQACALHAMSRDGAIDAGARACGLASAHPIVREIVERHPRSPSNGDQYSMLLIEKALFLKDRGLFQDVPDDALIDVAAALEEVEVLAGERIFEKGELGASMYVLVEGKVRIHDGETELATLTAPDVFGELAALDSEPRSASVTALDECRLFRLDQDALYDLMSERVEVARGVISVLCAKLRAR